MPPHPPLGTNARHPGSHRRQGRDGYCSRSVATLLAAGMPYQGSPLGATGMPAGPLPLTTLPSALTPSLVTLAGPDEDAVAQGLPHGPTIQVGVVAACGLEPLPEGEKRRSGEVGCVLPGERLRDLGVRPLCSFDESVVFFR